LSAVVGCSTATIVPAKGGALGRQVDGVSTMIGSARRSPQTKCPQAPPPGHETGSPGPDSDTGSPQQLAVCSEVETQAAKSQQQADDKNVAKKKMLASQTFTQGEQR
jgi:hypothetical protein